MSFRSRRPPAPPPGPQWRIRYQLFGETISETYLTKQCARDRYFTIKEFAGVQSVELRGPGGRLWFKDHFFAGFSE